jgi:hypothetical protein
LEEEEGLNKDLARVNNRIANEYGHAKSNFVFGD